MVTRSQGKKKSVFPANTAIPAGATFDFVADGVNYKITFEDIIAELGVTGVIGNTGALTATELLTSGGGYYFIRRLEVANNSGLNAEYSPQDGVTLELDAQVENGTGVAILDSNNKIRNIKSDGGCTVTVSGDDILISVP